MLLLLTILLPATAGTASYFIRPHLGGAFFGGLWPRRISRWPSRCATITAPPLDHWIGMDSLSAIFLVLTSLLFLGATVYGIGYVAREPVAGQTDSADGSLFKNEPESASTASLLLLLATMTLAIVSRISPCSGLPSKPPPWPAPR